MMREVSKPPTEFLETIYSFGQRNGSWWPPEVGDRSIVLASLGLGECVRVRGTREFRHFMSAKAKAAEKKNGTILHCLTISETLHIWRTA